MHQHIWDQFIIPITFGSNIVLIAQQMRQSPITVPQLKGRLGILHKNKNKKKQLNFIYTGLAFYDYDPF